MGLKSNYSNLKSYSIDRFYEKYIFSRERLTRLRGELSELRSNIKLLLYFVLERIYFLIHFFFLVLILYKLFRLLWQLSFFYIVNCFLLLLIFISRLFTYSGIDLILLILFAVGGGIGVLYYPNIFTWFDCLSRQSDNYIEKLYFFYSLYSLILLHLCSPL